MENSKSLISIIIPVYNVPEEYLRKCLNSICTQSFTSLEVIIVDDGSTDQSGNICDEIANIDNRISVIHKKNEGLAAARNTGYENSHSEWIMFVDGDDWIETNMCQELYRLGTLNHAQIVMCGMFKDYRNKSERYHYNLESNKVYVGEECRLLQEQVLNYQSNIATAYCKLISKKFLDDNHIEHDSKLKQGAEGIEFNLRLFGKAERVFFIDKSFYHYTYNDKSISASHSEMNHEYVLRCFEKIKEEISKEPNSEKLSSWLNNRLLYVIVTTAISGYFSPDNNEKYETKKRKYIQYLKRDILQEALYSHDYQGISKIRRLVLFLIKNKMFLAISFLAHLRKSQKKSK